MYPFIGYTDEWPGTPAILDHLAGAGGHARSRILLLLDRHELTRVRAVRHRPAAAVARSAGI